MKGAIKLPLILYEFAKADLLPESKDSLNYLYNVMIDNPNIVIQLRSHTDFRGSNKLNQKLSQRRAQSCVDYLVNEKGIPADRIVAKGMGEGEPLKTATGEVLNEKYINALKTEEEKEAAHQRNRRTDFKVLRDDYVPKAAESTEN
jgi:peptidoglycan-associated lipoprotein